MAVPAGCNRYLRPDHTTRFADDIFKNLIISMAKMLNLMFHDSDEIWNELPRKERPLTEVLGQAKTKMGIVALRRYLNNELTRSQITIFFSDNISDEIRTRMAGTVETEFLLPVLFVYSSIYQV